MEAGGQGSAPGWYPDPWTPGGQRWWDGASWTGQTAPGSGGPGTGGYAPGGPGTGGYAPGASPSGGYAPGGGQSTDGFAIASLVFGIIGGSVLAIIFGFVGKRRIKSSGGLKSGNGLATAGIVLGSLWLALTVVLIVLAATGALDSENADDFSGTEREVAVVVDRFEDLVDDEKTDQACSELLTPRFATAIGQSSGGSCGDAFLEEVEGKVQAELDVGSIQVAGDTATLQVEEAGDEQTWRMVRQGGSWRIDSIE